jgi:hypothetical protein
LNSLVEARHFGPERLKTEERRLPRPTLVGEEQWAMIREGRRQGVKYMILKLQISTGFAEGPVQTHQGWGLSFIAPSVFPILKLQFLKLACHKSSSEQTHHSEIKIIVALIFRLVNKVEVTYDEPLGFVCWLGSDSFIKELFFLGVIRRTIDGGKFEGGSAGANDDFSRNQVCAKVNVGNFNVIIVP